MEEWLNKYKLGHLWPAFKEQELFDVKLLIYMSDSDIKDVTYTFGDQIRLKRAIGQLAGKGKDEPPVKKKVRLNVDPGKVVFAKPIHRNVEHPFTTGAQILVTHPIAGFTTPNSTIKINANSNQSIFEKVHTIVPTTVTANRIENQLVSYSTEETVTAKINLENVLKNDLIGATLMQKSKTQSLTNGERDKICDITVRYAMNLLNKIDYGTFDNLASQIERLFKNEAKSTYYVPAIRKSESSKHKSERARGKLVDKYRNRLHLLRITLKGAENKETEGRSRNEINPEVDTSTSSSNDSESPMKRADLDNIRTTTGFEYSSCQGNSSTSVSSIIQTAAENQPDTSNNNTKTHSDISKNNTNKKNNSGCIKLEVNDDCDDEFDEQNTENVKQEFSLQQQSSREYYDNEVPLLPNVSSNQTLSASVDKDVQTGPVQPCSPNAQQNRVLQEDRDSNKRMSSSIIENSTQQNASIMIPGNDDSAENRRLIDQLEEVVKLQRQYVEHEVDGKSSDPMCNREFLMSVVPFMSRMPLNMNVEFRKQLMGLIQDFLNRLS